MQDLTPEVFPDGPAAALVPSSQHAGNRPTDQRAARSAPGSASPSVDTGDIARPPFASAQDYRSPTVVSADGAKVTPDSNQARGSLFTRADGSGWRDDDPADLLPETRGKARIVLGKWQDI